MLSQLSFKLPFGKQNRWPNSQESTGVYLATIGHNKSCWEAVGQARTAFGTLQIEIAEYIDQTCESLSKDVVWSLYMVGRARETASPTVTFISTEPGPRQRLKILIKESKLLEKHPGFITMDIDRPPGCKTSVIKTLGGLEERSSVSEAGRMEQIAISVPSRAFMGTSIYLNERVPDLVATGGGMVQSRGRAYLTSVAHPFEKCWNDRFPEATPPGDYVFDIDEISDSEEEDEALVDITSGGSITSNSIPCDASDCSLNSESDGWSSKQGLLESPLPLPNRKMATGLPSGLVQANTILSQRRTDNQMSYRTSQEPTHSDGDGISNQVDEQSPPGLPRATTNASTPALAQDEPLIYNLSGPIISSARGGTFSLDYSLFELPDFMLHRSESSPSDKSLQRSPSSAPREPRSTEIVVHTASGTVAGRLLATPSFMQPAQGMLPQQLWTVIMEGTLQSGLCGSWVMDASSGDVFGHIIAGAPEDGFAYMVPFCEILDDLNINFGGDWTFAETALRMRDSSSSRPMVAQNRGHEFTVTSNSQMGSPNFDTYARRGHPNAESLDDLSKCHGAQETTVDLGDSSDTNSIENFKAWIISNSLFAAGSSGNDRFFIPYEQLQQFFKPTSKVDKLKSLLSVCGTPADIDVETIRKSFIKVFSILLLINKASYIQDFILRENLSDSSLPFRLGNDWILEDKDGNSFYDEFIHAQWQFCAPVFHLHMDTRFDEQLIPPFTKKEKVHDGGTAVVYKFEVHPDYNAFKHGEEKQPTENIFILKTYSQGIESKRMYDSEIEAFRKLSKSATSGSIIGYYGTSIQGETYNILLEYADKRDLESFFLIFPFAESNLREYWKATPSPAFSYDNVFWVLQQCKAITSGLQVVHERRYTHAPSNARIHDEQSRYGRHGDLKAENILWFPEQGTDFRHLVIAALGLTDFHKRSTRSDIPAGHITGSPSYEPPELRLHSTISRAYDIWTLGCLYLEFVTWLVCGHHVLEKFPDARTQEDPSEPHVDNDTFFTFSSEGSPGASTKYATIRNGVSSWIQHLHQMPRCSAFIHDFLDLIADKMLLVDPSARIKIGQLNREIQGMILKAKDPSYLIHGLPRTPRDQPLPHQASLAAMRSNGYTFLGTSDGTPLPRKTNSKCD